MFVGHYGISFAAKAADPSLPLSALAISTQLLDVAWSTFILTGIEKVRIRRHFTATNDLDLYYMPYSHGLPAALAWSGVAGLAAYLLLPGQSIMAAAIMAAVCLSHWALDLLVHTHDLPLFRDRFKAGFGLWNYRIFALVLELGVLAGGAAVYMASLAPAATGLWWFTLILSAGLGALHTSAVFGPPPKSVPVYAARAFFAYFAIMAICYGGERFFAAAL